MENSEEDYGNEEEGATDSIDDEVDNEVNKFTKFCANHLTSNGMNHFQRHNEFWPELWNSWGDSLSRVTKGKELKGVASSLHHRDPLPTYQWIENLFIRVELPTLQINYDPSKAEDEQTNVSFPISIKLNCLWHKLMMITGSNWIVRRRSC